jgi:hypothetical protein
LEQKSTVTVLLIEAGVKESPQYNTIFEISAEHSNSYIHLMLIELLSPPPHTFRQKSSITVHLIEVGVK